MIGCIIQARMGSSRLPGKVLMDSGHGKPLLYYVVNQLQHCEKVKNLVIATTTNQEDDEIEKFANNNSVSIFRGSEKDVLDRYFQCAKKYSFSTLTILKFPLLRIYGVTCSRSDGNSACFHVLSSALNENTSTSVPIGKVRISVFVA